MTGALSALLAASSGKTTSSSGTTFIIFLVLIALVGYFLLIRPQKQKQRRQREQQSAISVGDEILTVGGIVGRVIALDADRVTILTGGDTVGFPAVGNEPTRLVLVRNAVSRKLEPPLPTTSSDTPDDVADAEAGDGTERSNGHFEGDLDGHDLRLNGSLTEGAEIEGAESEGTSP
ncbi:MAG: preprotein translocase subunit YajC [Actinomycetota bacterium]|jgi:preprotein translocase subunit YajC|nr:preprotein translocase subunit YajC [Actinomycetota bacterium]